MLGLGNSIGGPDVFRDLNDVPSLQLWLKNAVGVAVGQWDDSSRQGRHVTQATSGNQAAESGGGLDFENYMNSLGMEKSELTEIDKELNEKVGYKVYEKKMSKIYKKIY